MHTLAQLDFDNLPWLIGYGGVFQFLPLQPPIPTSTMYFPPTFSGSGAFFGCGFSFGSCVSIFGFGCGCFGTLGSGFGVAFGASVFGFSVLLSFKTFPSEKKYLNQSKMILEANSYI